ncbi:MAG TPA: transposase, partial [Candidatus Hodarchaeales archaeon]|nr:transposase [Candidatus Hodarchaeales archaeon]
MPVRRRLSSKERIELLERVTKDGVSVAQACRSFGVSRFTFYRLAKRYLPSLTSQLNLELLADRYRKGQAHYRKLTSQDERAVLEHVRLHPSLSTHKLAEHFPRIGNHGIQTIFKEFHLSKRPDREVFSEISLAAYLEILKERGRGFRQFLDASQRYLVLQRVLGAGDSVSQVCRETGISRFTFYQWLKQFREDKSQTRIENRWRSGASHYRAIPQDVEKLILKSVIREPLLSSHGLAARIPQVGNHGVQNILRRHHLSNSAQRLEYSRIHGEGDQVLRPAAGWEGRPKQVLEEFV